ncbi:MAG: nicotinate-nucleotide adenylyltransferase [Actinomycetota bacterium]
MPRRIGLLGGTFDPLHIGHLVVADQVLDQVGLDEVRLVVSHQPWQKVGERAITPPDRRFEMVAAAVAPFEGLEASDVEICLGGPSYTVETLAALERDEPGVAWSVIVGADAAAGLDTWHEADKLRREREIVVVNRPGAPPAGPTGWRLRRVEIPSIDLSSTEIRTLVGEGRSVRHLVPDAVMHRIERWGLYRRGS